MSALREKLKKVHRDFGDRPPRLVTGDLGVASRDPDKLMQDLGLSGFSASGNDGLQDIHLLLDAAVNSSTLSGLFGRPIKSERSGSVTVPTSGDIMSYGSGALASRFIRAVLAAAENTGKIALPTGLSYAVATDNRYVMVYWRGFAR